MAFVKLHQPCQDDSCGSTDGASINSDGSAYCFVCRKYFHSYSTAEVHQPDTAKDLKGYQRKTPMENSSRLSSSPNPTASFNELTDRKISLATAKKFGVRSTTVNGKIDKHYYPYYNGHELAGTKIRMQNKNFSWAGSSKEVGLFGENLFKAGGKFIF